MASNKEKAHEYYLKNKEKIKEQSKLWHQNNVEKAREIARNCYHKHQEEYCKNGRERMKLRDNKDKANTRWLSRRTRIKQAAVDYLGGKCERCDYNRYIGALEFHHINPEEKDTQITALLRKGNFEIIKKELDKCKLLCSNCHREIHEEIRREKNAKSN